MYKGTIIFFLSFLISSSICFGQETLTAEEQEMFKAAVMKQANSTQSISSDFTQLKYLDMLQHDVISKGRLVFQAPDNILWQYKTPNAYQVIFKDNMLYVDNKGEKDEIKLSSNKLFRSFNTLIVNSIKGDMFDDAQFDISYFKVDSHYQAKFIPKQKRLKKFVGSFILTFDGNSKEVTQVKLNEPNGDYTLISFENRKTNSVVPAGTFKQ